MSSLNTFSPGQGDQVEAVVKWFNFSKGFGFVAPADGSPDAFIHLSVLSRAGLQQVVEGTKLLVELGSGPKGRQVLQIIKVLGVVELNTIPSSSDGSGRRAAPSGEAEELIGTIKWFKTDKGFGFATPDDGGKDVFVHKSLLQRIGLSNIDPGRRVKMVVYTAEKGREASLLELLD